MKIKDYDNRSTMRRERYQDGKLTDFLDADVVYIMRSLVGFSYIFPFGTFPDKPVSKKPR